METVVSKNKAEYFLNNRASLLPRNLSLSSRNSFTLVELIIVVIIVGILASLGLTQYNLMVEKSRTVEAKVRIGVMRQLAYEYYLNNGDLTGIESVDLGVDNTCTSTDFFRYYKGTSSSTVVNLVALRCTSGGKVPNASRAYYYYPAYYPSTDSMVWHCRYLDNSSSCFGLTPM
jgi:prepilin-type N-terminal cleavage/methylation domain-containing protein